MFSITYRSIQALRGHFGSNAGSNEVFREPGSSLLFKPNGTLDVILSSN
jgi:hypothetical protein